jgi:hypothetical protein
MSKDLPFYRLGGLLKSVKITFLEKKVGRVTGLI